MKSTQSWPQEFTTGLPRISGCGGASVVLDGDGPAVVDAPALHKDLTEEEAIRAYFNILLIYQRIEAWWRQLKKNGHIGGLISLR